MKSSIFKIKEIVTLVTITHVVNACMCGPNQRNIPVEPEKGFLGYHLQCYLKRATGVRSEGERKIKKKKKRNKDMLICLALLTFRLKVLCIFQEIKGL